MTTKMPQRPKPHEHHEHGPRPYDAGSSDEENDANAKGLGPMEHAQTRQATSEGKQPSRKTHDTGQFTGEGQPPNMKK